MAQIADLLDILAQPERITDIIGDELTECDTRRIRRRAPLARSCAHGSDLATEDLIAPQDMVVTLSHAGYIKAQPLADYRAQRRGGRGKQAAATKEDDWIDQLFIANTHDYILCFSNRGRVYWLKVWEVPQGCRASRGKPIVNMFPLAEGEKITVVLPVQGVRRRPLRVHGHGARHGQEDAAAEFTNPRKAGIIAVDLDDGDFLIGAAITDGQHDVMLFQIRRQGGSLRRERRAPDGPQARGVRGMQLDKGQRVIALLVAEDEQQSVLTATENGFGKRTPIAEYTRHGRGTKGMIAIQQSERNGKVVAATPGAAGRRDHADHHRRRADPHARRDPRDGPRHPGRDADRPGRGQARRAGARGGDRGR